MCDKITSQTLCISCSKVLKETNRTKMCPEANSKRGKIGSCAGGLAISPMVQLYKGTCDPECTKSKKRKGRK